MRKVVKRICHPLIKYYLVFLHIYIYIYIYIQKYVYIYIYRNMCVCIYIYIYIHIYRYRYIYIVLSFKTKKYLANQIMNYSLLVRGFVYNTVRTGAYFSMGPQQIRKLRRELESSQEKVADLTMQLSANVCMIHYQNLFGRYFSFYRCDQSKM